ncbi:MAG: hypothetical protein LBL90_11185 [Prevotellaceae bacterium]|jgi:hypothetical protein|nr:hypothetical protein [Prevotellaceae bacterium]
MKVPYTIIGSSGNYEYIIPDIKIEQELEEWLENKDNTLEKLMKIITN